MKAELLGLRYRGGGHVESWFLKANDPSGQRAIWVRNTLFARPRSADRHAEPVPPVAECWAVAFDREKGHVAVKSSSPFELARFSRGTVDVTVDGCELSLGSAKGAIESGGRRVAWDLAIGPQRAPSIEHLPSAALYDAPFPTTKAVSPLADVRVTGRVEVLGGPRQPGETWDVSAWPAMLGHNWGRSNAHLYAWSHCNSWESVTVDGVPTDDDLVFEGVSARVRIGPVLSPMASAVFLRFRGLRLDLNGREIMGKNRGNISLRRWEVTASSKGGARVHAELAAETDDLVGLFYPNPGGSMTHCLNSKLARAYLEVTLPGGRALVARSRSAALEIGTRDPNHGVRMYV